MKRPRQQENLTTMETAKVDIRKLQLLTDRVNQCLDALNQVRFSVYGLSHTGAGINAGINQAGPFGPVGQIGQPGLGYGPGINPGINPMSAFGAVPYAQTATPFAPGFSAWNQAIPSAGLSHSGAEIDPWSARSLYGDPLLAARVAQTFPYAQSATPPLVSFY